MYVNTHHINGVVHEKTESWLYKVQNEDQITMERSVEQLLLKTLVTYLFWQQGQERK